MIAFRLITYPFMLSLFLFWFMDVPVSPGGLFAVQCNVTSFCIDIVAGTAQYSNNQSAKNWRGVLGSQQAGRG